MAKVDIIPFINDGSTGAGHPFVRAAWGGWDWFFHGTERPSDYWTKYTPRQAANMAGNRLLIHNPGGRYVPMTIDQFVITSGWAESNPSDADLQAHADWPRMIKAAGKFVCEGGELVAYVGGEAISEVLPNETPSQWAKRKEAAIAPLLRITPHIARLDFDFTLGQRYVADDPYWSVVGGRKGGMDRLIKKVQKMGIQVGVEATAFKDATWLHDCTTSITDSYLALQESKGWIAKDAQGQKRELVPCLEMQSKPICLLRGSISKTNTEKWEDIRAINAKGYTAAFHIAQFPDPETI